MARTITQIHNEMLTDIASNAVLSANLTSNSMYATFRLFTFTIASAIWILEKLFDQHKLEIDTALYEQKSGTPRWYRNMSLQFQFGVDLLTGGNEFDLLIDSDKFDNGSYTIDQIEASKIIKYCSVKESSESNRLIIKVAGETSSVLSPLTDTQLTSFSQYLNEIKYAGVKLAVINNPADLLLLNMQIYRDVLVLDEFGNSIFNGGNPVEDAIKAYMRALPFDGELVLNDLIAHLRAVDGVDNANITLAQSSIYNSVTSAYDGYEAIDVRTIPVAGYFSVPNFDEVSYTV
jgi:hypothetical protein